MCGGVGFVSSPGAGAPDSRALDCAVAAFAHRGPDKSERFELQDVALACTRLGIIDLLGGSQR